MSRSPIIRLLLLCIPILLFNACQKTTTTSPSGNDQTKSTEAYLPLRAGLSWNYRVTFPTDAQVPYTPVIEYPEGLVGSTLTHGLGSWSKGTVDLSITTTTKAESSTTVLSYEATVNLNASKFFFYITGDYPVQLRRKKIGDAFLYDLVGNLPVASPYWRIARCILKLAPDSLKNTVDVTVPAGEFKACVKSTINMVGDGTYLPSGTYPIDVYSAADVGIVKMVGKAKDGSVLYTMELFTSGSPPSTVTDFSGTWVGTYSTSLIPSVSVTFNLTQSGSGFSGTYSAVNGASGTISGTVGTTNTFTLSQTTSTCPGSFNGTANVNGDTMSFTFTGSDCLGNHANGKGRVQRISTSAKGALNISSTPSGAAITLDGLVTGKTTPATIADVSAGGHAIKLSLNGYADTTVNAIVVQTQTTFVSVTLRSATSSSDSIFVRLRLVSLPRTMKFNQSHVPNYYTEHSWGIYFDTDDNPSTGLDGFDIEICCTNYKPPGSTPSNASPIAGTSHQVIEWIGTSGYTRHSNVSARLDPSDSNTIIMSAPASWPELSSLSSSDRFYFSTYYYDTTHSVMDRTDVSTGTAVVTDPVGDVSYSFIDIVSGQWSRASVLPIAGRQVANTIVSSAGRPASNFPGHPPAALYYNGKHYQVKRTQ